MASKSSKVKVDFTGVEAFTKAEEGIHPVKIIKAEEAVSQGGNDMISVRFQVTSGESKGSVVIENYPLTETALWKLKALLQAIGLKADGRVTLDLNKLLGKSCRIEVNHEEYNGTLRARVGDYYPTKAAEEDYDEDLEDEDDEEEEAPKKPAKKATKKTTKKPAKKPPVVEDDDEDEDDEEDWDDEEDEEEDVKPAKKPAKKPPQKKQVKKPTKKSKPVEDDEDEDDEDWDDMDEDDWDED